MAKTPSMKRLRMSKPYKAGALNGVTLRAIRNQHGTILFLIVDHEGQPERMAELIDQWNAIQDERI